MLRHSKETKVAEVKKVQSILPFEASPEIWKQVISDHLGKPYVIKLASGTNFAITSLNILPRIPPTFNGISLKDQFQKEYKESIEEFKARIERVNNAFRFDVNQRDTSVFVLQEAFPPKKEDLAEYPDIATIVQEKLGADWEFKQFKSTVTLFNKTTVRLLAASELKGDDHIHHGLRTEFELLETKEHIIINNVYFLHRENFVEDCEAREDYITALMKNKKDADVKPLTQVVIGDFNMRIAFTEGELLDYANNLKPVAYRCNGVIYDYTDGCFIKYYNQEDDQNDVLQVDTNKILDPLGTRRLIRSRLTLAEIKELKAAKEKVEYWPVLFPKNHQLFENGPTVRDIATYLQKAADDRKADGLKLKYIVHKNRFGEIVFQILSEDKPLTLPNFLGKKEGAEKITYTYTFDLQNFKERHSLERLFVDPSSKVKLLDKIANKIIAFGDKNLAQKQFYIDMYHEFKALNTNNAKQCNLFKENYLEKLRVSWGAYALSIFKTGPYSLSDEIENFINFSSNDSLIVKKRS